MILILILSAPLSECSPKTWLASSLSSSSSWWAFHRLHPCDSPIRSFIFKAFFIIFQSFKFDGSVEDVEVSVVEADDFDVILISCRKSSMRKLEKSSATLTTRTAWQTLWKGLQRAWSWPSSCPWESWHRAGTRCSTATTSTSARSTGGSSSWSSSSSSSTSSSPWWATPMLRSTIFLVSSSYFSNRLQPSRTSGWDSGRRLCSSQRGELLQSGFMIKYSGSRMWYLAVFFYIYVIFLKISTGLFSVLFGSKLIGYLILYKRKTHTNYIL